LGLGGGGGVERGLRAANKALVKNAELRRITGWGKGGAGKSSSKKSQRQPKAVEELVCLASEIHAFRMLRQKHGEDVVDFGFTAVGKQFRVEVKATEGDDESSKLGSSEIRLAMEIGTKGWRREVFVLVHVKNALSAHPSAVVLPNAYDPKFAGVFSVEEADARVR